MVTLRQLFYEEGNILSVLQLPGSKNFSRSLAGHENTWWWIVSLPCFIHRVSMLPLRTVSTDSVYKKKLTVASDYHLICQPIIITCDLAIFIGGGRYQLP